MSFAQANEVTTSRRESGPSEDHEAFQVPQEKRFVTKKGSIPQLAMHLFSMVISRSKLPNLEYKDPVLDVSTGPKTVQSRCS